VCCHSSGIFEQVWFLRLNASCSDENVVRSAMLPLEPGLGGTIRQAALVKLRVHERAKER
jgi:hypothetical protein